MEIQGIPCQSYSHGNWEDSQLWKFRGFVKEIGRICDCGNSGDSLSVIFAWKLGGSAIVEIQGICDGIWEDSRLWKFRGFRVGHIHMEIGRICDWKFRGFVMAIGRICDCEILGDSLSVIFTWKLEGFAIVEVQGIPCRSYSHGNWKDLRLWKFRGFLVGHIHMEIGRIRNYENSGHSLVLNCSHGNSGDSRLWKLGGFVIAEWFNSTLVLE